jgi:hypothetical protein
MNIPSKEHLLKYQEYLQQHSKENDSKNLNNLKEGIKMQLIT